MSDGGGGLHSRQLFYPYGETRYTTGDLPTDLGFTGQREEASFGLYDYRARWYDPYLNRWIQPDTIIPDFTNPQSLNRYAYVYNNPTLVTRCPPFRIKACGLILRRGAERATASDS